MQYPFRVFVEDISRRHLRIGTLHRTLPGQSFKDITSVETRVLSYLKEHVEPVIVTYLGNDVARFLYADLEKIRQDDPSTFLVRRIERGVAELGANPTVRPAGRNQRAVLALIDRFQIDVLVGDASSVALYDRLRPYLK